MAINDNLITELLEKVNAIFNSGALDKLLKLKESQYALFDWLDEWYTVYKVPLLKESGLIQLRVCINKHIKQNFKNKKLNEYTALEMQTCLNKIESTRMRKYTYDTLGAAFRKAYNLDLVSENVMLKVDGIKHKRKTGRALTVAEQERFVKLIRKNKYRDLYLFYLGTGCRKSEALTVKWSDIDYAAKRIHIRGSKTENADRYVPLFPEVETMLGSIKPVDDYVFPITENTIKCNFKRIKRQYGLTFRIHDLRHTFATRCLESGITINTVQLWLGHSKASTTADIYTHVQSAFEKEEVKKMTPFNFVGR